MKKLITISVVAALCVALAGCTSPLTGRNNEARVTVYLEQDLRRLPLHVH